MSEPCPVCMSDMKVFDVPGKAVTSLECERCGKYHITHQAIPMIKKTPWTLRQRTNASRWLYENQTFEITTGNIDKLLRINTPSFHERADKILTAIEKQTEYAGQAIQYNKEWINLSWCLNEDELHEILGYLVQSTPSRLSLNSALLPRESRFYKITADGWQHLEKLKINSTDADQVFVAMWFDTDLQTIYNDVIAEAIFEAGYKPHRVDQREHNDKIDDEIFAQIRRSRFILADFTGHRGGVYFEAGFAKGLGLEVVWTCKQDEIDKLHFDIRQYNCISWEPTNLTDFKNKIRNRIERIFGRGTYSRKS